MDRAPKTPFLPFLASVCLLYVSPLHAGYTTYEASLEGAQWFTNSTTSSCELIHPIPRLGQARFRQESGGELQFMLDVDQGPVAGGNLRVRSVPPAWKHHAPPRDLGKQGYARGQSPLTLDRELALRLYYELENGMFPVLQTSDWSDGRDTFTVTVSAVRFRDAGTAFQSCVANLIHLDFDATDERRIYFATGSDTLTLRSRRALEEIIRKYRSDPAISRIVIGGHADERGEASYNEQLSLRRARTVRHYLIKRGIKSSRIETRYYGESWPANPESTRSAWAQNRRTTIWITR